ncbi:MAG: glucan biosynthesis protein D [Hyphomicrobium sp.]|nr:MAG: glucan biosynthesis protein D [Hyphomicrobium sp.]
MMVSKIDRRLLLQSTASATLLSGMVGWPEFAHALSGVGSSELGSPEPFSFEALNVRARALSEKPFAKPVVPSPDILDAIDYDQYQKIRYRPDKSIKLDGEGRMPLQFFHLGKYAKEPVRMHVVEGGKAREVLYSDALFDMPANHPAKKLKDGAGFAGFRVMAPDLKTDWLAAMGASYFRTSGPFNQYGLSARGIAIDTAMPRPEEFPRFSHYWLEEVAGDAQSPLIIYALLDGPSVTGAYRIKTERLTDSRDVHRIVMEIDAHLYARKDIERLGIAPFSSMFWYGEADRKQSSDWRPEIHDSDGLAILTGSGERIWRPIVNPPRVMTSTFIDRDVKGFGLLQRDRDFVHYLDDGVFYERRASVWVEPLDGWGEGAVHLVEIPTNDETDDNIVAYWAPKNSLKAGEDAAWRYRLTWLDDIPFPEALARTTGTWTGIGGRPGHKRPDGVRKFVIDFQGKVFAGMGRNDGIELVVTASRGEVSNSYNHPVVDQRERWRAFFDIKASGTEPVDLRAFLRKGEKALSETWIYQFFPEA